MTKTRVLSGREKWLLQVAAAGLVVACGGEPSAAPVSEPASPGEAPADDGTLFPDATVAELLGGQSGVEGGCFARSRVVEDAALDQVIDRLGYRPLDLLAYAVGVHPATVRWGTVDPPAGAAPDGEALEVEIAYVGPTRTYVSTCSDLVELPVTFHVRSQSGVLDLEGEGTLHTGRNGGGQYAGVELSVEYPLDSGGDWAAQAAPVLDMGEQARFGLRLRFTPAAMTGSFHVFGCELAQWPADTECQVGVEDPEHGARVGELFQRLEGITVPDLHWADGTTTSLTLEAASSPHTACVAPVTTGWGQRLPVDLYSASLDVHVSTGDGRVDVILPARVGGWANAEGQWSRLAFSTNGEVTALPDVFGHLDFEAIGPTDRAVLDLSAHSASGQLAIASLAPHSPALRDIINSGCAARAGQVTKIAGLGWAPPLWWQQPPTSTE